MPQRQTASAGRSRRVSQGLVVGDLQGARRASGDRLADRGFTCALLVNGKLPVDNLEHGRETFDAVARVDAHLGIIDYFPDAPSSSFAAARKIFPPLRVSTLG
jgi:hypothetical protein